MKNNKGAWWNRHAEKGRETIHSLIYPSVRAWMRPTIEGVLASSQRPVGPQATKTTYATAIPKRAMKLLRKIASGYRLIGVLEWGTFWLYKKALLPALTAGS